MPRPTLRNEDFCARYGGEEFACILPQTDTNRGMEVAAKIAKNVEALCIPHADSIVTDHVTISQGVASTTPSTMDEMLNLLELADQALYKAKELGRNQVFMARDMSPL